MDEKLETIQLAVKRIIVDRKLLALTENPEHIDILKRRIEASKEEIVKCSIDLYS